MKTRGSEEASEKLPRAQRRPGVQGQSPCAEKSEKTQFTQTWIV